MKLARLNINGFKSFPDRAELAFDHGVTAIVGPNGCGKSNVVDAIAWVLGEQSAKSLRGERMEDVIFNGSDARKPTGAAEVRLKFTQVAQVALRAPDPADVEVEDPLLDAGPIITRDVEIGRRLYRSGESEYLIDGEICRLRDVHDLLMDSGLGVKAYAVIEQGKIGQILSSRPTERRVLIEEAAGVTKYKTRRRAAELKLEAARQNLTRVDDIIAEVEKQRSALKRQAAKARRYRRLREDLRRWEQVHFARRAAALAAEMEAADARLIEQRTREAAAAARVAEIEAAVETLKIELAEAEATATAAREAAHARELEIGRRQQQIQFDTQQARELGERADALEAEARDLDARVAPAQAGLDAQREGAARARAALEEAEGRVAETSHGHGNALVAVQLAERQVDQFRGDVSAMATRLAALRQARDHAAFVRDRVAGERTRLDVETRDLEAERARAEAAGEAARATLEAARRALGAARQARTAVAGRLAERRDSRATAQQHLAARQREAAAVQARLQSLEELEAGRLAFGEAARLLLSEGPESLRRHGAVADHLSVDRSYEHAVDALLSHLLEHVLVETPAEAADALRWLEDRAAGRCGFLVIAGAAGARTAPTLDLPAGARRLSDIVHPRGPHAAAIARAMGDAAVVDSLDAARALAAECGVPVATMAGEVVRGGWLIEGGGRGGHGILATRGEIVTLREALATARDDQHRIANELTAVNVEVAEDEDALAASTDAEHAQEKAIVGAELQVGRADEERSRVMRRLDVVGTEMARAADEEQASERRRAEAESAISTHEAGLGEAESRLNEVVARLQRARDDAAARQQLVTDARTAHAALGERAAALDADVAQREEALRDLADRVAARRADLEQARVRRGELEQAIREAERQWHEEVRALDALKVQVVETDDRLSALRGRFDEREHDIRGARQGLEAVRAALTQAEVARARAASDREHLAASCLETVNLDLAAVIAEVARMEAAGELAAPRRAAGPEGDVEADEVDEAETAEAVGAVAAGAPAADAGAPPTPEALMADLRLKIERLGPVNMMAIEQFDELEARHTFLTTQRQDLQDSIAQTDQAIARIDKTTRERFDEAFASINEKFQATFATLFGGGRAGLVLIDQENDVESGVDIIAQPPGKRLQNVQLLSGGEKALTAMALMFAIFQHRPSPFCLLDEIDAPLDDANIGRFIDMLRGMQAHTQFILITHNRKTMEIADRLYGVTMEEPGVSKLISLQLN